MQGKSAKPNDIWKTFNKIKAAIFRVGLNLWDYYLPLDPNKNGVISESHFCSVLAGPLRGIIGLTDHEIGELADYFRVQDGRVLYTQFCKVIYDSIPDFSQDEPIVTGFESKDPLKVNRLSITEERRISLLITKIAVLVNLRKLVLRPYFQDYELVAKNNGAVTIAHFARILEYLGIMVSASDFNLLVKKYIKDSYTLNYVAFIADIDAVVQYFDDRGMLDLGGDILKQLPGRVIDADLPKLLRPEINNIFAAGVYDEQNRFRSVSEGSKQSQNIILIVSNIQNHVFDNRLPVSEFFRGFDPLETGKVTESQYHRGVDALSMSGRHRIFLSLPEIEALMVEYRDPTDPSRVCWKTFADDINKIFITKDLNKCPCEEEVPPQVHTDAKEESLWQHLENNKRDLCDESVMKIKERIIKREILLKPAFRDYDIHNNGRVLQTQMCQCLATNGILLSDEELFALEQRFTDDMGFNYYRFLTEVEPSVADHNLFRKVLRGDKKVAAPQLPTRLERKENNIVMVLAKIKGKVVRERIRVLEFLRSFDKHNEGVISREDFKKGIRNSGLDLTETELDTLICVFGSPTSCNCVDYKRFVDIVEEAFSNLCSEQPAPKSPIPDSAKDCDRHFLNFDERRIVSMALEKITRRPDTHANLLEMFQKYDHKHCGTIPQEHFLNVLTRKRINVLISATEFEAICKAFGFVKNIKDEVDYIGFVKALDILVATSGN